MTPGNFSFFLPLLSEAGVRFILIGGGAGTVHGLGRTTYDVDLVYERTPENLEKLASCLKPVQPYLRGMPPGLPFQLSVSTLRNGLNFTLTTSEGDLDLFGETSGGGSYERLRPLCDLAELYGHEILVINLETLIHLKTAAGRPKDIEMIAQLRRLQLAIEETSRRKASQPEL